jgi:hypothetical protein
MRIDGHLAEIEKRLPENDKNVLATNHRLAIAQLHSML